MCNREATIHNASIIDREAVWQCGLVVGAADLKSGDPEFKSCADHRPGLFQVVSGSTPQLQ